MKVLHFTNKPIYPVIDGGCVAMKNTADLLGLHPKEIELTHFTLATHKHPFDVKAYPNKAQQIIYFQEINTRIKPVKLLANLWSYTPYNVQRFYDSKVAQTLEDILVEHEIEVVLMESIYLLPYLPLLEKYKVYVRTHNVEWKLWADRAEGEKNPLKKFYAQLLSKQLKNYEAKELQKVEGVISISEKDNKWFKENHNNTTVIHTSLFTSTVENDYANNDFYFLGAFDWEPNREAMHWLLDNVLKDKTHNFTIHLAGKNLDPSAFSEYKFIKNHGEVEDADAFIQAHGIALVPLRTGGGVKMKVLESFRQGKPTLSTSEGIRGLTPQHKEAVYLADDENAFFEGMLTLSNNENLRKAIGLGGKQFLNDNFAPDKEAIKLLEFISRT